MTSTIVIRDALFVALAVATAIAIAIRLWLVDMKLCSEVLSHLVLEHRLEDWTQRSEKSYEVIEIVLIVSSH